LKILYKKLTEKINGVTTQNDIYLLNKNIRKIIVYFKTREGLVSFS